MGECLSTDLCEALVVTTKWVYVDESGTEPKQGSSGLGYFALTAVAVRDAEATRAALANRLSELDAVSRDPEIQRVLDRGYFHASEDSPRLRRFFLSLACRLDFHCRTAILHPSSPPGRSYYDSLVIELFEEMLPAGPWTDEMHVVVAPRGPQSPATGKGREYEARLSSVRRYLDEGFPSLAGAMPNAHDVKYSTPCDEPCLQLPDYCGWAIQRWLSGRKDDQWLRALYPKWLQGGLALYKAAGDITGVSFSCTP